MIYVFKNRLGIEKRMDSAEIDAAMKEVSVSSILNIPSTITDDDYFLERIEDEES
jgi:hypothetical protein